MKTKIDDKTHTPGPWNAHSPRRISAMWEVTAGAPGFIMASVYREQDARLIAAAPDLLEAAKAIQVWMMRVPTDAASEQAYAKIVDAIAKAEGKEKA